MGFAPVPQRTEYNQRPYPGSSKGLSIPVLACAAALVTAVVIWLSDATVQQVDCSAFSSFLDRRHQHAHVQQMLSASPALLAEQAAAQAAGPGLLPATASTLGRLAADAMRSVGWRSGIAFAKIAAAARLDSVLDNSSRYSGAFVLIVPGNGSLPTRRSEDTPFFSVNPAHRELAALLSPAAAALNRAAGALEALLGRRLFPFRLETADLPGCAAGIGPCCVWEASSGRVVLDAGLAGKMAGGGGAAAAAQQPGAAGTWSLSHDKRVQAAAVAEPRDAAAASRAVGAAGAGAPDGEATAAASGGAELGSLVAAFVDKLAEEAAEASSLLQAGKASLPQLAAIFARAGPAALSLVAVAQVPLWWCIACPIVLGMLAPFLFNFGLTAAAEALCAQMQLPADTCNDLWWGAFAVALTLSLASAIPIVYICRLPECGRRGAAAVTAAVATARMFAS